VLRKQMEFYSEPGKVAFGALTYWQTHFLLLSISSASQLPSPIWYTANAATMIEHIRYSLRASPIMLPFSFCASAIGGLFLWPECTLYELTV